MSLSPASQFSKIRSFLWPVHAHELKKFIPMLLMLFFICFDQSILRNMKDTIIVTAKSSGAEVIPFIKVWVLLPMAVLLTTIFIKLSNRYSQEKVVYLLMSGFLLFYSLFTFVLFPMRDFFHPHAMADHLESILPIGFKGLIAMFRYWTFTIFYVMSELWGSIILNVLFWGFANEVTRIGEARRFYSIFGVGSNMAAICAGQAANYFTDHNSWDATLTVLMSVIIACGLLAMMIFRWMNYNVLTDPTFDDLHSTKKLTESKKKPGIRESFVYLSNSKYLICLAIIVIAYNLVINLVEIVWKDQLRLLYPLPNDYNTYMNNLTSAVGVISTLTSFFMAQLIGRFGWTRTALITPMIMLITSAGFFSFLFFREHLGDFAVALTGMTSMSIAVFFGSAQVCLSKAAKYSVFDTTKEMAFIPLGHECKLKGKAAIDGVGSRLGKSGGSLIHQGLLMVLATIGASTPFVAGILTLVISLWIIATRSLGQQFNELVATQEQEKSEEKEPLYDIPLDAVPAKI